MNKPPIRNLRWYIAILLCLATELNYLDRQTLSVLADTIQRELHLTTVDYARITSSFLISYAIMYAVSGRLIDALGTRRGFILFASGWSLANMLHALANTAFQFSFFRFLLGATEPANFPAGVKAVSEWFPMRERALAVGIFNAGTALGSAAAVPLVSAIALKWGWRYAFILTGGLGFLWVAAWTLFYRSPQTHPRLSDAERRLILSDTKGDETIHPEPVSIARLLSRPETWGCIAARVLTDPISYFLFFWTPKYFQQERGFNLASVGLYVWIPYMALTLGNLASGGIPRYLISRGWSVNRARKVTMLVVSSLMPVLCLFVTRVSNPTLAIVIMTAIMFGHAAWGNIILPAEVFPKHVVGTVSGFGGALGAAVGAVTQRYIGTVVQNVSFAPIFAVCSVMYLIALGLVHVLIGELGRIRKLAPASTKQSAPQFNVDTRNDSKRSNAIDNEVEYKDKLRLSSEDIKFLKQLKITAENQKLEGPNMFDKYTEKAKRVLFFARYEASQLGSHYIEAEHLLLGLLREDKRLVNRFVPEPGLQLDDTRERIKPRAPIREKTSTSIEIPLNNEAVRVLNFANEESLQLSHKNINTGHLLLGLLREENTLASEILREKGLILSAVRQSIKGTV